VRLGGIYYGGGAFTFSGKFSLEISSLWHLVHAVSALVDEITACEL
jgi:hypothetical protein